MTPQHVRDGGHRFQEKYVATMGGGVTLGICNPKACENSLKYYNQGVQNL